ncbi:hypothetical protein PGT21_011247 [Puccinia graminis f. sp. tritici]|uniref:Uncharacterized protein n=1 Tax=Puccinia graminis f. sp. tritici TaxID=56615 RepID=A0A5B0PXB1_PUCGR|nr:hypothetical protein PGT21_011247 [Puccinia graminis f. sp. tritici]KAA1127753.1 hypothetical protein PGTUg99_003861 [Puccinia graminis f. sp. tritici]
MQTADPNPKSPKTGSGLGSIYSSLTRPDPTRHKCRVGFGHCFWARTRPVYILTTSLTQTTQGPGTWVVTNSSTIIPDYELPYLSTLTQSPRFRAGGTSQSDPVKEESSRLARRPRHAGVPGDCAKLA